MAFFCYICEEESTHICARCTKDSCDNHLCERCHRCSDCCECEVRLDEQPMHPAIAAVAVAEREEPSGKEELEGEAGEAEAEPEPRETEAQQETAAETTAFSEDHR